MKPKSVSLHIDHLVLEGFPADGRQGIGAALEQELARLLAQEGAPRHAASYGLVNTRPVALEARDAPARIGSRIAAAVYRGLPK